MKPFLWALAAVLGVLSAPAAADDCTFPNPPDNMARLNAGDIVKPPWNRAICILNKLQTRALQTARAETVCSNVTVSAGQRLLVALTAASPLVGTELVLPEAVDDASPPMLVADGPETPGGAAVNVYVFNRDAVNQRTGEACALIVRP